MTIRANLEEEQKLGQSSYADCFKNGHNKIAFRTLTGIFIQAWVDRVFYPCDTE